MTAPQHPIAALIRKITDNGSCPRIFVAASAEGVEVPDHVREEHGHRLLLDLNPQWPLHLVFDDEALYADLSFRGELSRCRIPYGAIWAVMDGDAQVEWAFFEKNLPEGVVGPEVTGRAAATPRAVEPAGGSRTPAEEPDSREPEAPSVPAKERPRLRVLKGGKD